MSFNPSHEELKNRIIELQKSLRQKQLDGAWISHKVNLFYFTGTAQTGHLIVPSEGGVVLLIKKYFQRALLESPLLDIREIQRLNDVAEVIKEHHLHRVGVELDNISVNFWNKATALFPDTDFVNVTQTIRSQRSKKTPWEINQIQASAEMLDAVFTQVPAIIRDGMRELDLAAEIEYRLRMMGHQGSLPMASSYSYVHYGNILFGPSGAVRGNFDGPTCGEGLYPAVPKGAGWRKLNPHEPIFIDLVAGYAGYLADATRVFSLGSLSPELIQMHRNCLEIQDNVIHSIHEGLSGESIYNNAVTFARKLSMDQYFMGPAGDQTAFIAHGIGLEVDELPLIAKRSNIPISLNSVIALEPKAVVPGKGAVGIENTWVIQENGPRKMLNTSDEITII